LFLLREQDHLKKKMLIEDVDDWSRHRITPDMADQFQCMTPLKYVGGVDISFVKGDNVNACAALVVLSYPELEVGSTSIIN
jgi:deoxyinosine 3'endonuclease (endonuclease V)